MGILDSHLSADTLASINWHRHIDPNEPEDLWALSTRLFAVHSAMPDDTLDEARLLKLLCAATSLRLIDGGKPPFQPMVVFHSEGKRSPALEDFDAIDAADLAAIAATAPTTALRARLADLATTIGVEVQAVPWRAGAVAVEAYLDIAEKSLVTDNGVSVLTEFVRGLQLLWVYCRKKPELHTRYWDLAQAAITYSLEHDAPGVAFVLAEQVKRRRRDLSEAMAQSFEMAGTKYQEKGGMDTAARCFEMASQFWRGAEKVDAAKRCAVAQGEALVARAATGGPSNGTSDLVGKGHRQIAPSWSRGGAQGEDLQHQLHRDSTDIDWRIQTY